MLWGGKCGAFEPSEFEQRNWINDSEWPVSFDELKSYYKRASYELNIPLLFRENIVQGLADRKEIPFNRKHDFKTSFRCFSDVTGRNTGSKFDTYRKSLLNVDNILTIKRATVSKLEIEEGRGKVFALHFLSQSGVQHRIFARYFVLAAGGLENPRILLNSEAALKKPMGHAFEQVGCYFGGHAMLKNYGSDSDQAKVRFSDSAGSMDLYRDKDIRKIGGLFSLTRKSQWRNRMADFSVTFEDPSEQDDVNSQSVFFMLEQLPNPNSKISLVDDVDALGVPKIKLDWQYHPDDIANFKKGVKLFENYLRVANIGTLEFSGVRDEVIKYLQNSRHHIGTTRMSTDTKKGVVDGHCKVHGIENLYMAGTSVFPTNALANPSLTMMALALKLADNLGNKLSPTT